MGIVEQKKGHHNHGKTNRHLYNINTCCCESHGHDNQQACGACTKPQSRSAASHAMLGITCCIFTKMWNWVNTVLIWCGDFCCMLEMYDTMYKDPACMYNSCVKLTDYSKMFKKWHIYAMWSLCLWRDTRDTDLWMLPLRGINHSVWHNAINTQ